MSTPEGWYPDPSEPAQLRWWDGSGWTEHTHAAPPRSEDPSGAASPPWSGAGPAGTSPAPHPVAHDPRSRVKAIATPDGQALAGRGYRLAARLLDGLFVGLITAAAGWELLVRLFRVSMANASSAASTGFATQLQEARNPELIAISSGLTGIFLAVSAVYTILPLKFRGATLGKLICGIRVRGWDKPGPPSWGQAVLRWVTSDGIGSYVPFYLLADYLWPVVDRRRQALHDKLGRTVVVERDHREAHRRP